jgi:hypothetical protein
MAPVHAALPKNFRKIRLALAREPGHPEGDVGVAYDLFAPLTDEGRIDAEIWREHRRLCRVVRYRPGEEPDQGHLVRRPGGAWAFHYDVLGDEPDEPGRRLDTHVFAPGEYITLAEDGEDHTYRIVSISPP